MEGLFDALMLFIFVVLPALLMLWGAWHGVRRAGYNGVWVVVLLIPVLNIIMMYVFAYATWPIETRVLSENTRAPT
jgi:hypothetical protein